MKKLIIILRGLAFIGLSFLFVVAWAISEWADDMRIKVLGGI